MRRQLSLGRLLVVVVGIATSSLSAQPERLLHARIDAQFHELGALARDSFDGLLYYPKEIRDACLTLSQYPDVVVHLNAARRPGLSFDQAIQAAPLDARTAARVLATSPDVLRIMEENLVVTGLVGMVYGEDPVIVSKIVDRMAEEAQSAYTVVIDVWVERLVENPYAAIELQRAADDFARESRGTQVSINIGGDDYGFGFSIAGESSLEVYYTPSYRETEYILVHADRYPHLADEIVFVYQNHHDHCMSDMRSAFERWYNRHASCYGKDFWHPRDRAGRLADAARFERRFDQSHGSRTVSAAERNAYLRSHAEQYPHLRGFVDIDRASGGSRAQRVIAARQSPREYPSRSAVQRPGVGKSRANQEDRREGAARNTRGVRRPDHPSGSRESADERSLRVTRKQASDKQRLHRAERSHRGAWQGSRTRRTAPDESEGTTRTKRTP